MRPPDALLALIEDGVIDEVLRPLKSGKEATIFVVRSRTDILCAKVYKDMAQRSFQATTRYQEGRRVRGSRQARAMGKSTKFGRREQQSAWKNAEADALRKFADAGIRVPRPHGYHQGVLLMELVMDADGQSAPRLGEVELFPDTARAFHAALVQDVVRMLCLGLIHGDLSAYNVLVAPDGPVIIDFPQVVSAAGNNAAREMLLRDVHNLRDSLGRFAPELNATHFGEEMWALYERDALRADTPLSGHFDFDTTGADLHGIMMVIEDARREAMIRQRGREEAAAEGAGAGE